MGEAHLRTFEDEEGLRWEVVLGRESWGALYAILVPSGGREIRQAPLRAEGWVEASRELEELDREGLLQLLRGSEIKTLD